jgi:hypothetical protein
MSRTHLMSGGRYPVLRAVGILYVIGALVGFCYGLYKIGWILFASPGSMGERFELALQASALLFFGVVTILAIAELIKLMIDIEHNTRAAAMNRVAANGSPTEATTHVNRMSALDEESAEAALLRGH